MGGEKKKKGEEKERKGRERGEKEEREDKERKKEKKRKRKKNLTEEALVMVSWVVKVLEAITKRVVSGLRERTTSLEGGEGGGE